MKKIAALCIFLLFSSVSFAKEIIDLTGEKIIIPDKIERIAVIPIPWMSMIYTVDNTSDKIIGMHPSAKDAYNNSILKTLAPEIENINSTFVNRDFSINSEILVNLKPDLVIIWDYQKEEKEKLAKLGIPAVAIKYGNLEDVKNGINLLGEILNKEQRATDLIQFFDQNNISNDNAGSPKILYVQAPSILYIKDKNLNVASGTSVNDIMIDQAGGINVTHELSAKPNWVPVSMEQIIAWDPAIIILSNFDNITPADLYEQKLAINGWNTVSAVKNNKVFKAPIGIYRWDAPSIETPLMIKWIANLVNEKGFNDEGIKADINQFYQTFFNITLTEEQMNALLNYADNQINLK